MFNARRIILSARQGNPYGPAIPLLFSGTVGLLSFGWAIKREKERNSHPWARWAKTSPTNDPHDPLQSFYALPQHQQTMSVLVAINGLVFMAHQLFPAQAARYFILYPASRKVSTLLTSHASLGHFAFNMFALWSLGGFIHQIIGREYFLALYLTSGVMASTTSHTISNMTHSWKGSLGASGAIYGIAGYLYTAFPTAGLLLFFVLPAQVSTLIPALAVFDGLGAMGLYRKLGYDLGLDHAGHLGGLATGFLLSQTVLHPQTGRQMRDRLYAKAIKTQREVTKALGM